MIQVRIPGRKHYTFQRLVLDMNGTITLDGDLLDGLDERMRKLSAKLDIFIATADTHGGASRLAQYPWAKKVHLLKAGAEDSQKAALVRALGPFQTVAIGNGANDVAMLREAGLGICVLGSEGTAVEAILNAKIAVTSIVDALDLLLTPKRLIATLRK